MRALPRLGRVASSVNQRREAGEVSRQTNERKTLPAVEIVTSQVGGPCAARWGFVGCVLLVLLLTAPSLVFLSAYTTTAAHGTVLVWR